MWIRRSLSRKCLEEEKIAAHAGRAIVDDNDEPISEKGSKEGHDCRERSCWGCDAVSKAAVRLRERARRATATRGSEASSYKTSHLRLKFVRPKFEDDQAAIKVEGNVSNDSMRTKANNIYLLGISKPNSELISVNGASHLAGFLEAKRTGMQAEDVKQEPVKVEEKGGRTVLGQQINRADGMVEFGYFAPAR